MNADEFNDEQTAQDTSQRGTEFFLLLAVLVVPLSMWAISQGIPGLVGQYAYGLLPQALGLLSVAFQAAMLPVLLWIALRQPLLGGRVSSAMFVLGLVLFVEPTLVTLLAVIGWVPIADLFLESGWVLQIAFDDIVGSIMVILGLLVVRSFTRFRVCHRSDAQEPVLRAASIARLLAWTTLLAILFALLRLPWDRFNQVTGAAVRPGYELIAPTAIYLGSTLLWVAPAMVYLVLWNHRRRWQAIGYAVAYWLMYFAYLQVLYFCYPDFQLGTSFIGTFTEITPYVMAFCCGMLLGTVVFERLGFHVVRCPIRTQVDRTPS